MQLTFTKRLASQRSRLQLGPSRCSRQAMRSCDDIAVGTVTMMALPTDWDAVGLTSDCFFHRKRKPVIEPMAVRGNEGPHPASGKR